LNRAASATWPRFFRFLSRLNFVTTVEHGSARLNACETNSPSVTAGVK
jgi:hypothetical protein